MASKREVGAAAVREWFNALPEAERFLKVKGGDPVALSVGKRGKLSEDVVTAFEQANRGQKYVAGFVQPRKITGVRPDAKGRNRSVTLSVTDSEVRAWARTPEAVAAGVKAGERGVLSKDTIAAFVARPAAAKAKAETEATA